MASLVIKEEDPPFGWNDVRAAAYTDDSKYIITSPNSEHIPEPFVGLVHVCMRTDYRYGENDPFQWPQPLDLNYAFLSVIRHPYPETHRYAPLWWSPQIHRDFEVIEGSAFTCLGHLRSPVFDALELLVFEMSKIVDEHIETTGQSPARLSVYRLGMIQSSERIKFFPSTFRDLAFQVRELQRFWLLCRAWVDYSRLVAPGDTSSRPLQTGYIGAFTTNPGEAQTFCRLGIPVWFIRPVISVNQDAAQRVLVSLRAPSNLVREPWQTDAPAVFVGLSGARHLDVICAIKHMYLDVSQSPLLYRYDYSAESATTRSEGSGGPSHTSTGHSTGNCGARSASSKHKATVINNSKRLVI